MKLNFNLIGCSTWVMDIDNKFKIGCDPSLAPKGTKYIYKGLKTSRVKDPIYNKNTFDDVYEILCDNQKEEIRIHPAHGESSTIGEKKYNHFYKMWKGENIF